MTNYIIQVARANGLATKVIAEANGVNLSFIKGKDGRPLEVSRSTNYPVYYPGALYVRKDAYAGVIRQVAAILHERPKAKQAGFVFEPQVGPSPWMLYPGPCPACGRHKLSKHVDGVISCGKCYYTNQMEESDNGRCSGCTKSITDPSSCFDSCPLFTKED
jgi:hypothetical protein